MFDEFRFLFSPIKNLNKYMNGKVTTHVLVLQSVFVLELVSHITKPRVVEAFSSVSSVGRMSDSGVHLATSFGFEDVQSSLTPTMSLVGVDPPPLVGNTHSMVTRAKVGIFKLKVFSAELRDHEP